MRLRNLAIGLLAASLLVPLSSPGVTKGSKGGNPANYIDLKTVPKPKITGAEIIKGLEEYVARYPMRQSTLPLHNEGSSEFLAAEAKKYGFKSRILTLDSGSPRAPKVRVVEAIKKGTTKPNEWIAFIAHYDTVEQTVQGAYDDGSGTNMLRYFAKAFSKIKTNRSIALLWFDGEEQGKLASAVYAKKLKERGQKIAAGFGFDMVGIGYPARYCICVYHGPMPEDAAKAVPIAQYVNFDFLKFPEGDGGAGITAKWPLGTDPHVCICGPNPRNSDEQNFASQGYFTMRWTGMRTALDYPGYHQPWDTVPFMEMVAGSRKNLEDGTENTFLSAYYTAFVIDNL
ncbi:MAG TPA: M28 family peptidase [Actinomycetota bacterium]|nr:M28 family peptidase [Actinomycetota bacterium]